MSVSRAAPLAVWALLWAAPPSAAVVAEEAMDRARADGHVVVIVALRPPEEARRLRSLGGRRAAIARRRAAVLRAMRPEDVKVVHAYESVAGFVASASPAGLERLGADPDVLAVDVDEIGWAALDRSVPQIRADVIHRRGITGTGTVIAILDTGVESSHPDIHDALLHEECFCRPDCCPDRSARQSGPGSAATRNDHGMNVAGIALSRGVISPAGVAPGAQLVAIKVINDAAFGTLSDWTAALDWIVANRPDVRVINMSLQTATVYRGPCDGDGAINMLFSDLIDQLYRRGTLLFAAAGNIDPRTQGSSVDAIASPACISRALGVGAVDRADIVSRFSDSAATLDLLAPGVDILSDGVGGRTSRLSGTSMASPHAAGLAALLYSVNPSAGAALIEGALKVGGVPVTDHRNGLTFPRIDAVNAFNTVARSGEFLLGGGGAETDCLLQWNFVPPSISRDGPRPFAECRDNDPLCDLDTIEGQCTFALALCFNARDPRVPRCSVDEPLLAYDLTWPRGDGPGSAASNAENLLQALPAFPLAGTDVCTVAFPYVVIRPQGSPGRGIDAIRLAVRTQTRRDYDRVSLICNPPAAQ